MKLINDTICTDKSLAELLEELGLETELMRAELESLRRIYPDYREACDHFSAGNESCLKH